MSYEDPSTKNAGFPDRPTHPDFALLSNVVQGMDVRAEAPDDSVSEILPLDVESVLYFVRGRLGVLSNALGIDLAANPVMQALYIDALTVGLRAGQARR